MIPATITETAIDWHLRQRELSADEWSRFVAWLEVPAHACAYDRIASADRTLDELRHAFAAPLAPAAVRPGRHWAWAGGAVAASAAIVLALPMLRAPASRPYVEETRPGEQRSVTLADATRIELNGATRLVLDRANPRVATLDGGEAVFHVRHDAAHPFTLRVGKRSLRDLGTVFDVALGGDRIDVAVAEGAVAFDPGSGLRVLRPGQALAVRGGRITLGSVAPDTVGGWRTGRLSYTGAPLASVAWALERRYGTPVSLAAGLPDRPFTGTIRLSGSAARDIPHLAALIGAGWRRDGQRWFLAPEAGRTP